LDNFGGTFVRVRGALKVMCHLMFGVLALVVTSFVKTINHFNFFLTGVLSPMFFLCGVVFPTSDLPPVLRPLVELMPLTHVVRWVRAICASHLHAGLAWDLLYIVAFSVVVGWFAVYRLRRRLVS
jgi:lipooligosaccharide transport system permease protein